MQINKIIINNFRKIKNGCSLYFGETMLLVGKNNSGKTSIFELLSKFLGNGTFFPQDFNIDSFKREIINTIYSEYASISKQDDHELQMTNLIKKFPSISMDIFINILSDDNVVALKPLLYEFENNETIVLKCKYEINDFYGLIREYEKYNLSIINLDNPEIKEIDFYDFVFRNINNWYKANYYSTKPNSLITFNLDFNIKALFNIKIINARRDVDDTQDQNKQNISLALWDYYSNYKKNNNILQEDEFKNSLLKIQNELDANYDEIFSDIVKSICKEIFVDDTVNIKVKSEIDIDDVLKRNSKLKYFMNDIGFTEASNGLGYSNLIYIFVQMMLYKEKIIKDDKIFNILFIEEPESHLHPQLQSRLFEKINSFIIKDKIVYTMISTHSSYLLQQSKLEWINYFCNKKELHIKSIKQFLEDPINDKLDRKDFFIKYFKLNTCDLFFADKTILVEGAVERIVFPTILNKFDKENKTNLSKQHISILEIGGTYAYLFYDLLKFLEINTLIITDNDCRLDSKCKCDLTEENKTKEKLKYTSNPILKKWFNCEDQKLYILDIMEKQPQDFIHQLDECQFKLSTQLPKLDNPICGRTFEEELILTSSQRLNDALCEKKDEDLKLKFKHLREIIKKYFNDDIIFSKQFFEKQFYDVVDKINKTDFAVDLITSSDDWDIPDYIKDGLLWLK